MQHSLLVHDYSPPPPLSLPPPSLPLSPLSFPLFFPGLRPETTSEDIFSACKDGDEFFCKEWAMNPEHDLNQR